MSRHEFIEPDDDVTEPDIPIVDGYEYEEAPVTDPIQVVTRRWWQKIDWVQVILWTAVFIVAGLALVGALMYADRGIDPNPPSFIPIT